LIALNPTTKTVVEKVTGNFKDVPGKL